MSISIASTESGLDPYPDLVLFTAQSSFCDGKGAGGCSDDGCGGDDRGDDDRDDDDCGGDDPGGGDRGGDDRGSDDRGGDDRGGDDFVLFSKGSEESCICSNADSLAMAASLCFSSLVLTSSALNCASKSKYFRFTFNSATFASASAIRFSAHDILLELLGLLLDVLEVRLDLLADLERHLGSVSLSTSLILSVSLFIVLA